jgi:hypothetical protein
LVVITGHATIAKENTTSTPTTNFRFFRLFIFTLIRSTVASGTMYKSQRIMSTGIGDGDGNGNGDGVGYGEEVS